jgi:Uma2 family endonuclease
MGLAQPVKRYTPSEYYQLEREAGFKSEYYGGEIFAMAGGTTRHSRIVTNIVGEIHQRLKGSPCTVLESNQRLKVLATGLRAYPDVNVYCDPIEYDEEDAWSETATNPTVVFEVLSPSTESYDRGFKSAIYRQIELLKAYVLIAHDEPRVEVYTRQPNNSWLLTEASGLDAVVALSAVSISLLLSDVYDRVEFGPATTPPRRPPPV